MSPDSGLLRALREAIRQAKSDLESLTFKTVDDGPAVARLQRELHESLVKNDKRLAKEARERSARAKKLSDQHSRDLAAIKKRAKVAAAAVELKRKRQREC
jgi:hypothetical protein